MKLRQSLVRDIVRRVRAASAAERIILFGSAAEGTMTPDSDIDLLVVMTKVQDERAEWLRVRSALRGLGYPFDVFLMSTETFEQTKSVVGGLAHPADKHGKILYQAA